MEDIGEEQILAATRGYGLLPRLTGSPPQALVAEQESKDSGGAAVAEQVLSIMEIILDESNAEPLSEDKVRGAGLSLCRHWEHLWSHCRPRASLCPAVSKTG